jgi:predicted SprT family Zn-dependent metalloprotease
MMDRTIQKDDDDDLDEFLSPTEEAYADFYTAWDYFNGVLFENTLPDCLITMQRYRRSKGYFASERFGHRQRDSEIVDEIALNPATFRGRTDREIISTLVHEMVHQWQQHFGKPSRRGYHNQQWAAKMNEIGLVPSHTGEPGGKETGQRVSHYIREGGLYDTKWQTLAASGFTLNYRDRRSETEGVGKVQNMKVRYTCPGCSIHVWGKPDLAIICEPCGRRLEATDIAIKMAA